MTEEEAKTKWCPLLAIGRALMSSDHHCVGSRCMMWTFSDDQTEHKTTDISVLGEKKDPTGEAPAPDGEGWKKVGDLKRSEAVHYKSRGIGDGFIDGPFTVFFQKWERERLMREGDCSLTL